MSKRIDVSAGTRFGRLVVTGEAGSRPETGERLYACRCDCGKNTVVRSSRLRFGITQSCGCYGRSAVRRHGHVDGGRKSKTYVTWQSMMARCRNSNSAAWPDYGGRGITVCDRWLNFENFVADMGERPEGMTIDRKDVDGNYEPDNCRWATRSEQNANKRPYPEASRRRMSAAQYERFERSPVNEETRARQSAAAQRRWRKERKERTGQE